MKTLKEVLIERDGLTANEADAQIDQARNILLEYIDAGANEEAYNICADLFGLEPDFLQDLI